MDREAFEQLVSAWLDEPHRADLRARLERAVAAVPELAEVQAAYVRLVELLRRALAEPPVDWAALKARVAAEIDRAAEREAADPSWDARLRAALPGVEARVDWQTVQARIAAAVAACDRGTGRRPRRLGWRVSLAAGSLAAAAALLLWFGRPGVEPPLPPVERPAAVPVARAEVVLPPGGASLVDREGSVARMTIDEDPVLAAVADPVEPDESLDESDPEVYFMLDPLEPTLTVAAVDGF